MENSYLETKYGIKVDVKPETDPAKVLLQKLYLCWKKLFMYWVTAGPKVKTANWVQEMDVELFRLWINGDLEGARKLLTRETLDRVRRAKRRTGTHDSTVPTQVAFELEQILNQ